MNKNFSETTLTSQTIYNGKIITVQRDGVRINEEYAAEREVVRHPGGVVILAEKDNKILMVRQFRYPMREILYELPAGKLEYGEEPFGAAKRELEEETGYVAGSWTDLGFVYSSPGFCDEKLYLYKAKDLKYTKCNPDEGEILEPLLCDYDEVLEMIKDNKIRDAKTLCVILKGKFL